LNCFQVVFVTFIAYAMLPLRTYVAALFSVALAAAHLTLTAIWADDWLTWQQVSFTNHILFLHTQNLQSSKTFLRAMKEVRSLKLLKLLRKTNAHFWSWCRVCLKSKGFTFYTINVLSDL